MSSATPRQTSGQGRLYEAYASTEAVRTHAAGAVFTEVGPELIQTCRFTSVQAFGDTAPHVEGLALLGPVSDWGPAFAALA